MLVGVDHRTILTLPAEERDKLIIKNLGELFGAAGLVRINTWPDGLKEVCFLADGYCRILHLRNGFVLTDFKERRDYGESRILRSCISGSACRKGCGCPCLLGQGYREDSNRGVAMSHCKDFIGDQLHYRGDTHSYCLAEMYDSLDSGAE